MVSRKFYNAFRQANMMITGISAEEYQNWVRSPESAGTFEALKFVEEDWNKDHSFDATLPKQSIHLYDMKIVECLSVMEKILLGKL